MAGIKTHLVRIFVAGLLAILPLAATVALLVVATRLIVSWLGPESFIGRLLIPLGGGKAESEILGYVIGLGILLASIFALGLLVEKGLQRGLVAAVNALVRRIPVIRTIYETLSRFVDLVSRRDGSPMKAMQPVWCHFGGEGGVSVLGLLSTSDPVVVGGQECLAVILPTAPVPVGGALLYVPAKWVKPAKVSMEALTSIYVTMGVSSPQYLQPARPGETVAETKDASQGSAPTPSH